MASLSPDPTYTVFIRLPFPRGDFVDPPPVNWEPSKDDALWNIVSNLSKTEVIDWNEIAAQFQVTVDFLLQKVAWLTDRHASQVRAQMRKAVAAAKVSPAPSPQLQTPEGGFPTDPPRYLGSAIQPRAPSSASVRRDSPLPRSEHNGLNGSTRGTPRPPSTRNSSANTIFPPQKNSGGGALAPGMSSTDTQRRRLTSLNVDDEVDRNDGEVDPQSPGAAESSSGASSSSSSPAQSRIIRRPPRFQGNTGPSFADDEDDEDDVELAFNPYRPQSGGATSDQPGLSMTLRGNLRDQGRRPIKGGDRKHIHQSQTSDSSASSIPASSSMNEGRSGAPPSPRRNTERAMRSPAGKSKAYSRDSDGTPSMSSSFSDLDDASVTQSALEEALASRMRDGGTINSLRGTISNVFKSRYQGNPGNAP